jgi:dTMP kinase
MTKCDETQWDEFLAWLEHYEYDLLGLPRPDCVIFLDMPIGVSQKLLEKRYEGDGEKKDIHERDVEYLYACRRAALYAAKKLGWIVLPYNDGDKPLSPETIHKSILECLN